MNLLVFKKQPYSQDKFHIILNVLLQIVRSESWFEKSCPYDQEGFIAVLLVMPKSHRSEFKKRQKLHILLKFKRVFSSMYGGIEYAHNCL